MKFSDFLIEWPPGRAQGRWVITVKLAEVRGRAECIGLEIRSRSSDTDGTPEAIITASLLRQLPVGRMINKALKGQQQQLRELGEAESLVNWIYGDRAPEVKKNVARRRRIVERTEPKKAGRPPEIDFREIAEVYLRAWAKQENATQAVAKHFTISHSAAAKRVSRAREKGLIPPVGQGIPPTRKRKTAGKGRAKK